MSFFCLGRLIDCENALSEEPAQQLCRAVANTAGERGAESFSAFAILANRAAGALFAIGAIRVQVDVLSRSEAF